MVKVGWCLVKHCKNASYPIPTGFGLWKPTPPGFIPPVNVYVNETRTFVKNILTKTLPKPPIPYSEEPGSAFYNQAKHVYTVSQSLTPTDILTVKTWGEFPGNYTNALRYQQLTINILDDANLPLDVTALSLQNMEWRFTRLSRASLMPSISITL